MSLSSCEPEEQVLFSLYKEVDQKAARSFSFVEPEPEKPEKNEIKLRGGKTKLNRKKKEATSESIPTQNTETKLEVNNKPIDLISNTTTETNTVVYNNNIPISENNRKNIMNVPNNADGADEEMGIKPNNLEVVKVISPNIVKIRYIFLLFVLFGVINVVYFIFKYNKNFSQIYLFYLLIFGIILIATGILGFLKMNSTTNNSFSLPQYLCIIYIVMAIVCFVLSLFDKSSNLIISIIINLLIVIFSIICIILISKLKKEDNEHRQKQLMTLIDKD